MCEHSNSHNHHISSFTTPQTFPRRQLNFPLTFPFRPHMCHHQKEALLRHTHVHHKSHRLFNKRTLRGIRGTPTHLIYYQKISPDLLIISSSDEISGCARTTACTQEYCVSGLHKATLLLNI